MQGLRREGPEIPGHLLLLNASLWVSLLAMKEVRELDWISDEENGSIVSNHIVVAFLSVEFERKATGISVTVVSSTLSGDG